MQAQTCPCGSCVSCACAAAPSVDGDGICVACGGVPYVVALRGGNGRPHVTAGPGFVIDDDERAQIVALIATAEGTAEARAALRAELLEAGHVVAARELRRGRNPDGIANRLEATAAFFSEKTQAEAAISVAKLRAFALSEVCK